MDFLLSGDLCQMTEQKIFLRRSGIPVGQTDVYPTVPTEYKKQALFLFYTYKVAGWWNYEKDYISEDICTKEEFWKYFKGEKA